jgi:hypothetical protein
MPPKTDIVTESGKRVPELTLTPTLVLDKISIFYGPTKSGKSILIRHIMKLLLGYIDQVICVSPTAAANGSYDGIIEKPLLHSRLYMPEGPDVKSKKDNAMQGALRFLDALYERQTMMASIYTRANKIETLAQLFKRLPPAARQEGSRFIKGLNDKRQAVIEKEKKRLEEDAGVATERIKAINENFRRVLILLYKKYITPHYEGLFKHNLTDDERYALTYLHFNPRLLLVLDDCAADLKPMFNKDVFRRLFYQGRWGFITCLLACQDDTDLPANLRKNALVSFYTESTVCASNFSRMSNKYPKPVQKYVEEVLPHVFVGNRKLAYVRDDRQKFYHVEVPQHPPFKFGSAAMQELCAKVETEGVAMDKGNRYYGYFRIPTDKDKDTAAQ